MTKADLADAKRCDGCGVETTAGRPAGDGGPFYCPGCQLFRSTFGIHPTDHDQYLLTEARD